MPRAKIGSIVEIQDGNQLWYAHYTHQLKRWGALLRVRSKAWPRRPDDLSLTLVGKPSLCIFFPLDATLRAGLVSIVGQRPPSDDEAEFPIFKDGVMDPSAGMVKEWWLWDGVREWRVGDLGSKADQYPLRRIINVAMLVHLLRTGKDLP